MKLVAAVDRNWGIGKDGRLLYTIPEDLRRFKSLTMGSTLLMGRKTFDSLPGLLPGRKHVVLSRDPDFHPRGVTVLRSIEEARAYIQADEVFLIGGAQLYAALLAHCAKAYITKIDADASADAFFPNLEALPPWRLVEQSPWREAEGLRYRFCEYENFS